MNTAKFISQRLHSIDFLRGLVIILMTVDHTRDMFYPINIGSYIPNDISLGVYMTRWITHLCAPIFIFLAGISVFLREQKYNLKPSETAIFLFKRGLFFIVLEFTLISFFWNQIFGYQIYTLSAQVIWAFGVSFIFLGLIKNFSAPVILAIGSILVFGHNLLDAFNPENSILWDFLHHRSKLTIIPEKLLFRVSYPLIPWLGLIALGYSCGYYLFTNSVSEKRRGAFLLGLTAICLVSFLILRSFNFYGDSNLFIFDSTNLIESFRSFLNVTKYPPSLLYFLITLPFGFAILALFKKEYKLTKIISNYGKAPLFYYILHLALITIIDNLIEFFSGEKYKSDNILVTWIIAFFIVAISYNLILRFIDFRKKYGNKIKILSYV